MRAVRAAARVFVYGTEDEERVVRALLDVLGRANDSEARGKLTRSKIKGHFGTEILLYEGVAKSPKELRRVFDRLRAAPGLVETLRAQFEARLDDDRVLHFRLGKQEAVEGTLVLGTGGDAIQVHVKYAEHAGGAAGFP
ncbi:MAG TPA: RNA-binding domain-containing protein [Candidatus Thermoplasmatota archaeon]|nr:RNA-binding domain-containing protein [Candidatus Thermoplasmatota archaeon]